MTATMLHGGDETVGTMTSGGTESILMAVKAYRDRAKKKKPWLLNPEMILPTTAHVAFDKASHYFGVKIRRAAVDERGQVDTRQVAKLINRKTIMIVGSAPQYPHGTIDPTRARPCAAPGPRMLRYFGGIAVARENRRAGTRLGFRAT